MKEESLALRLAENRDSMAVKGSAVGVSSAVTVVCGTAPALETVLPGSQEEFNPSPFVHHFILKNI